jgi:hypothetical protein
MKFHRLGLLAAAATSLALSACASIVDGSTQVLSVKTVASDGTDVDDAHCTLVSPKGTWYTTTPGTVSVHRAYDALNVQCRKDAVEPGIATVNSSTKGMALGNILAGGFIGAAVDMGTGAAYDYPQLITVQMGRSIEIGKPASPASAAAGAQRTASSR